MARPIVIAVALVVALAVTLVAAAGVARADPDADPADDRFRAATARAGAGDLDGALADFIAIADDLPDSPWADDALAEAAKLAERRGDLSREQALLERLLQRYPTSRQARWASTTIAELAVRTGGGTWTSVAAAHDALVAAAGRPGDPKPTLAQLGVLLRANPGYPRGASARIWLADAWGRQGHWDDALGWYGDAAAVATTPIDRRNAALHESAALVALDRFADAAAAVDRVAADPGADPIAISQARAYIDHGRVLHRWRVAAIVALALLAILALIELRRLTGSARAALRALASPPFEVWYLVPIAALVIVASATGNLLIARAVRRIAIGGVIVTWSSGVLLGASPRLTRGRIAIQVVAIAVAAAAIAYLAVVDHRLLDMLIETARSGPEPR